MMPLPSPRSATPIPPVDSAPELRICHVMSADLWAGAEVQVATLASYLVRRPGVRLSAVLLNQGRLAHELRALGVDVEVVDERSHSSAAIAMFLVRFLKSRRIEILHTHRYKDTVLGTIAAKFAGVPKVVRTVHGLAEPMTGWDRVKFRVYDVLEKTVLRRFGDRILAVSNEVADTLRTIGYRRSAVVAIHNGLDVRKARVRRDSRLIRRDLGIRDDALLIGTIGRLAPVKAHTDLLWAAQRILRQRPEARFLFVGDGPLRHQLMATAVRLGVDRACLFTGARQDTFDVLAAMDVFVLPSLHEGVPMALLEAMILGKAVVATAVGGVPEVVQDRVNGLLVPPRDERALAQACLELATDQRLARSLGPAARRTVAERFSHEVNGGAVLSVYRSLLDPCEKAEHRTAADLNSAGLAWELTRGLFRIAVRRTARAIDGGIARYGMKRIRRNPSRFMRALRSAKEILVVCHGNIIRSPFAAELLARDIGSAPVRVVSGGVAAVEGNPPHPVALRLAGSRAVDLSHHAAAPLDDSRVAASDVIFVMDIPLLVAMRHRFPQARHKTFLITCLAADAPLEIRDPVDGDDLQFQACFDHICQAVRPIVNALGPVAWAQ
jgi:L-malate glycosyltransferase